MTSNVLLRLTGCVLAAVAFSAAAEESHVEARLVSDAGVIESGRPFLLGVELELESGWHVYWRNPGGAGLSTEVNFRLPAGFSVGELQWPIPVEFMQPGEIIGYGYEDRVVLAAEVTAPAGLRGSVTAELEVSWLACKDVCILGSKTLTAELPLHGAALEASKTAIESWTDLMPKRGDHEAFDVSITGGPVPDSGPADLVVWLKWNEAPEGVEFFPDPGPGLKVEGVRVQTRGSLTRIDATVSRLKTTDAQEATLRALIVTRDNQGNRRATVSRITID
ncbi:MAG: protein-disulfide reductase DsbD domain-containing protein [Candidatus Sulfomarinibacteraceae bacterium]